MPSRVTKKPGGAEEGLKHIQKLYIIEKELRSKDLPPEDFLDRRKEQAGPILEKFRKWLEKKEQNIVPSSELRNSWPVG